MLHVAWPVAGKTSQLLCTSIRYRRTKSFTADAFWICTNARGNQQSLSFCEHVVQQLQVERNWQNCLSEWGAGISIGDSAATAVAVRLVVLRWCSRWWRWWCGDCRDCAQKHAASLSLESSLSSQSGIKCRPRLGDRAEKAQGPLPGGVMRSSDTHTDALLVLYETWFSPAEAFWVNWPRPPNGKIEIFCTMSV